MKRPVIISVCCLLLAAMAVAESVEVGTAKAEEASRNVRITVVLNGKPLKLATVEFCTTIGAQTCFTVLTGDNGVAVPHVLALTTYHVFALFEDDLSSDLYLHISPQGKATSFAMDLTPSFKAAQAVITAAEKLPAREIVREFTGSVQDSWGGMITEANIKVVRKGSADKANVLRLKSDANGHFSAQLTEGAYVAFFSSPGFRTEIVPFEVAALRREGNVGQVADWERIPIDEGEHLELNASTHSQGCAGSHDSHYLVRKFREDDGRVERVVAPDRESRSLHSRVDSRSESTGSVGMTGLGVDRNDRALK